MSCLLPRIKSQLSLSTKSLLTLQLQKTQLQLRKFSSFSTPPPPPSQLQQPGSFTDSIVALAKYSVPLIAICTIISIWGPRTTVRELLGLKDQADLQFQTEFLRARKENEMQRVVAANASIPGRITMPNKFNNEL